MLSPVTIPNPSAAAMMDAFYTAGTSTVYADGTARTPGTFATPGTASLPATLGTGSAWTWNYDATTFGTGAKTAVYAYPPTTTAINQVAIIGCTSSTVGANWKQLYADSRTASLVYIGLAKNSGVYTSWNNATTPFTSGDFTGFGILGGAAATSLLLMWECEEAILIQIVAANTTVSVGGAGAYIDPLSANTANAETDGRLYGVTCTGSSYVMGATWLSSTAQSIAPLFVNAASASDMHSVTFTPGAGTLVVSTRFGSYAPGTGFTSKNGDLPEIPFQMWTNTQFLGQLRQIFVTRDAVSGVAWSALGVQKGYILGYSTSTAGDAVLLTY
jgi:hypothetical protein